MTTDTMIGIDLAKSVFQVPGASMTGQVKFRKKLSRLQFRKFIAVLPEVTVVMEACGSAHHWAREITKHGHEVKLIAPQYVRPFVERVCRKIGYPKTIRVDNGSESISKGLDLWAYMNAVILAYSRSGKPTDNAFIESFNGKFRSECLNQHWFMTLDDARQKMEDWRVDLYEVVFVKSSETPLLV